MPDKDAVAKALRCHAEEDWECSMEKQNRDCPYCRMLWDDSWFGCDMTQLMRDAYAILKGEKKDA